MAGIDDQDDERADILKIENELPLLGLAKLLGANARGELHKIEPGMIIDNKWEVRRLLGEGGFGQVYEAWHLELDHPVAIKVLTRSQGRAEVRQRFLAEARLMAGMASKHLVRASDYGELPNGSPYFVMDLVKGRSLRHLLCERLPLWRALELGEEILRGVVEVHRRGVVHGDIKPENIVISHDDGHARLLDFGLAQTSAAEGEEVGGTPQYMAPEMLLQRVPASARTDVYAVGVVLYEMLTGRLPRGHLDMSVEQLRKAWATKPTPNPLLMYCSGVPQVQQEAMAAIDKLVMTALSPDPRNRPISAMPMLRGLRRLRKQISLDMTVRTPTTSKMRSTAAKNAKTTGLAISAIATVGILFVADQAALFELRLEPASDDMPFREEAEISPMTMLTLPHEATVNNAEADVAPAQSMPETKSGQEQSGPSPSRETTSTKKTRIENDLHYIRKMMNRGDWYGAETRMRDLRLQSPSAEICLMLAEVYVELDAVKNRRLVERELEQARKLGLTQNQAKRADELQKKID